MYHLKPVSMMNFISHKNFLRMFSCMLMVAVSSNIAAQDIRQKLKRVSGNNLQKVEARAFVKDDSTASKSSKGNSFGRGLVARLKALGQPLPFSEEKMVRLKPGKPQKVAQQSEDDDLEFTGMLQYNAIGDRMLLEYGFYKFSAATGYAREVVTDKVKADLNGRGVYYNHKLHGTSTLPLPYEEANSYWSYYEWDEDTWEETGKSGTKVGNSDLIFQGGVDYDPVTKSCYGFGYSTQGSTAYYKVDYDKLTESAIAYSDSSFAAFAIDKDGVGYAISENGYFVKVDPASGTLTYIGKIDFEFMPSFQDMTFDPVTNKLYLVCSEVNWDTEEMLGRLCEVNITDGSTRLIAYLPECEQYTCLNVLHKIADGAPADITDLTVTMQKLETSGKIKFTVPTTTKSGAAMSGNVDYVITVNDNDDAPITGVAAAGSTVEKDFDGVPEGRVKVAVVLKNSAGNGIRNVVTTWAGLDEPIARNIKLDVDESTLNATVTWENTEVGARGGYVDPVGVKYDVYRCPGNVKVANKISETKFTESLADCYYNAYYYKIIPYIGSTAGFEDSTEIVKVGKPYEIPYVETFDSVEVVKAFTIVDANGDGTTWEGHSFRVGELAYGYNKVNKADDWAITPPIHFKKGYTYTVKFNSSCVYAPYFEKLEVAYGKGTDPKNFTVVMPETSIENNINSPEARTAEIQIDEDGDYRIGFHCTSDPMMNSLIIFDMEVTAGQALMAPDSVKNLKAVAGEEGDLVVTLDFDAPTTSIKGETLTEISKIDVMRSTDSTIVKTIENPVPGKHYTVVDEDAYNGNQTYTVTPYAGTAAGLEASATVYVGYDAPTEPTDVALNDNLDGTATLSWNAPVKGQNGGVVDSGDLTYNIVRAEGTAIVTVKEGVTGNSYVITDVPQTGDQNILQYGVEAVNELGTSSIAAAKPLVYGSAYVAPYMEGFIASDLKGIWMTNQSGDNGYSIYNGISSDYDNWCIGFESEKTDEWASLTSGKIDISAVNSPKLVFTYLASPGINNTLNVTVNKNGSSNGDNIASINMAELTGEEGWRTVACDLANYKDAKYITITFTGIINDMEMPMIIFDDVNVRNVVANNITAYLTAQRRATTGQKAQITTTVHNVGENIAKGYKVNIFVNDSIVKTFTDAQDIAPFDRIFLNAEYQTKVNDPENTKVWATVEMNGDLDETDNTSNVVETTIMPTLFDRASDLYAVNSQNVTTLTWTAADPTAKVTESFEGYDTFSGQFGDWNSVDMDKDMTSTISGLYFPNMSNPMSFITFDFGAAGLDLEEYPDYVGQTGTQFVACFKPLNQQKNNDWLISPELSGNEQTIKLYAKSLAASQTDIFDILYSTTGNQVNDFTGNVIASKTASDGFFAPFTAKIPEGAKYFAIHCNSVMGGMLMIDDVTYEAKPLTLVGYNIYCDGVFVGSVDASTLTFSHNTINLAAGQHIYNVTAVYAEGESGYSNDAMIATASGIDEVNSDITGKVTRYSVDGRVLSRPEKGVNILRTEDGKTYKVIVKE